MHSYKIFYTPIAPLGLECREGLGFLYTPVALLGLLFAGSEVAFSVSCLKETKSQNIRQVFKPKHALQLERAA
jgi:hypothetical protein